MVTCINTHTHVLYKIDDLCVIIINISINNIISSLVHSLTDEFSCTRDIDASSV